MYIRELFEANKNVTEPRQQRVRPPHTYMFKRETQLMQHQVLIQETENLLEKWKHPDPYRPPTAPGGEFSWIAVECSNVLLTSPGSKYERNLPAPILDRESLPIYIDAQSLMLSSSAEDDTIGGGWSGTREVNELYILTNRATGIGWKALDPTRSNCSHFAQPKITLKGAILLLRNLKPSPVRSIWLLVRSTLVVLLRCSTNSDATVFRSSLSLLACFLFTWWMIPTKTSFLVFPSSPTSSTCSCAWSLSPSANPTHQRRISLCTSRVRLLRTAKTPEPHSVQLLMQVIECMIPQDARGSYQT